MKEKYNSYPMALFLLMVNKWTNVKSETLGGLTPTCASLLVAVICVFSSHSHSMNKQRRLMHLVTHLVLFRSLLDNASK